MILKKKIYFITKCGVFFCSSAPPCTAEVSDSWPVLLGSGRNGLATCIPVALPGQSQGLLNEGLGVDWAQGFGEKLTPERIISFGNTGKMDAVCTGLDCMDREPALEGRISGHVRSLDMRASWSAALPYRPARLRAWLDEVKGGRGVVSPASCAPRTIEFHWS